MIFTAPACAKCKRRNVITFHVEPEEAFVRVTLGRWKTGICPSCFDAEAEKAKVQYEFVSVEAVSWSGRPPPRNPFKRRR